MKLLVGFFVTIIIIVILFILPPIVERIAELLAVVF